MSLKVDMKNLLQISLQEEPLSEEKFRHRIFKMVLPALFIIFFFIVYLVTPILYSSVKEFYLSPITINIHIILVVLGVLIFFGKKGLQSKVTAVLPILFALISLYAFSMNQP